MQHTGTDTVTAGATKQVRLSYNHPVKELVWCLAGQSSAGAQLWNFTTQAGANGKVLLDLDATSTAEGGCVPIESIGAPTLNANGTAGSGASWTEEGADSASTSVGPLDTFKLVLNGQDRFKEQQGKYFNQVQPFQHHSGSPYPGVYSYSFALKPEEHQPTGTCNFSRIDNAQVAIKTKASGLTTLHMFATNYNVLRIQSGMGGLAFSN